MSSQPSLAVSDQPHLTSHEATAFSAADHVREVLGMVETRIASVWPLRDYVAVNPYEGFTHRDFWDARRFLRLFSDCETLLSLAHYRNEWKRGTFTVADLETAIDELRIDGATPLRGASTQGVIAAFLRDDNSSSTSAAAPTDRRLWSVAQQVDKHFGTDWSYAILEEIGKHCSAHYDEGQASWASPWKHLPLYEAWKKGAAVDRHIEILGLKGFRSFVSSLPDAPEDAIAMMLTQLGVPAELWKTMLLCEAFTMPGWTAWTKYQTLQASRRGEPCADMPALLAMRLAYDVALAQRFNLKTEWSDSIELGTDWFRIPMPVVEQSDAVLRLVGLRASEIAIRRQLVEGLQKSGLQKSQQRGQASFSAESQQRGQASQQRGQASFSAVAAPVQMVFCIDVRSERIRRHLEAVSTEIQTFGFAGFFAIPIAHVGWGEAAGKPQVPALLSPTLHVHETLVGVDAPATELALLRRATLRSLRAGWKRFQKSAVGSFGFIESLGVWFGWRMIRGAAGLIDSDPSGTLDGVDEAHHEHVVPSRDDWAKQGFDVDKQVGLAAGMLRGIGLTGDFGRLVVLCGHASQTQNNPLAAGLDCGACGGHSGSINARVGAMLCNDPEIRVGLAEQGIVIPNRTLFLAAVHNTTTDEIEWQDPTLVPASHAGDVAELTATWSAAAQRNRDERAAADNLSGKDWLARARDWSEVRPEWGLAGNTSFIVGPRELTKAMNLDGRSFLHSYDHTRDPESQVLEVIMTAPMVVAHWINQQYYASSVDPKTFGSGTKTIHNVVGKFGLFSGNGGDLMTGLPLQSLHDGDRLRHEPVRLQAVIAAPRSAIESVIGRHSSLDDLLSGGWLHLIAIEEGVIYRYSLDRTWHKLNA